MILIGLEKPAEQKRLRTLFDDILANKVKKRRANGRGKGKKKFRGRVLSLDGGGRSIQTIPVVNQY